MDHVQMIIGIPRVLPPLAQSGLLDSECSEEDCRNKPVTPRRGIQKKGRGFPGGSDGKESACSVGDLGSIPGLGRSLEKKMATHSSSLAWEIPQREQFHWRAFAFLRGSPKG